MVNISGFTQVLFSWIINPLMWLFLLLFTVGGIWLFLFIRRKKRLIYPTMELVDLGNGRCGFNNLKSGYFGKKLYFRGLWWKGEEVLMTEDKETIFDFSTEDFQEVNGERGVICYRDPLRQNVLLPISKVGFKNKEFVATIAPADYTDVAVSIVQDAANETTDWRDKLIQFGAWALVIVFSLVSIIVITQMVKNGQDKAAQTLMQAGTEGAKACKDICANALNVVLSKGSAP